MSKRTYADIQVEIARLQAEAESLKAQERADVIERIQEAIKHYNIAPQDLFGSAAKGTRSKSTLGPEVKYSDGRGNTWIGRGPRPQWLRDAVAAGKKPEDFKVNGAAPAGEVAAVKSRKTRSTTKEPGAKASPKAAAKRPSPFKGVKAPVKFRNDAGETWTGRGNRPRWLQDAIKGGKKLEDFAV